MVLPEGFLRQFDGCGVAALENLGAALATDASVSVRFNRGKAAGTAVCRDVASSDAVLWCADGVYLSSRPAFTLDPALHQGLYYVQDASSMFISHVVSFLTAGGAPVRYLDACAAPGGKTTAAVDALPPGSLVVANEYVAARAAVLRENLVKWGAPCAVCQGDTARFAASGAVFDIIAADVPCSGEGMMRKDPKAVEQWSAALVEECASRQRRIVDNLWPALAPGGYFIYSTCTFNRAENEDVALYVAERYGAESVDIPVDPSWGIVPSLDKGVHAFRFIPGAVRGEGLFMTVLRKPADAESIPPVPDSQPRRKRRAAGGASGSKPSAVPAAVKSWLTPDAGAVLSVMPDGSVAASFPSLWPDFPFVPRIEVASPKGRDLVPSHEMAMSRFLAPGAFPTHDVDRDTALEYLRCNAVALPAGAPRGIVLLTFSGRPLGFVKNIGPRANNLYPRSWRILK